MLEHQFIDVKNVLQRFQGLLSFENMFEFMRLIYKKSNFHRFLESQIKNYLTRF